MRNFLVVITAQSNRLGGHDVDTSVTCTGQSWSNAKTENMTPLTENKYT